MVLEPIHLANLRVRGYVLQPFRRLPHLAATSLHLNHHQAIKGRLLVPEMDANSFPGRKALRLVFDVGHISTCRSVPAEAR
eukprot:scaffold22560_cov135-Cylindrotheca_fusiformis.AAC.28